MQAKVLISSILTVFIMSLIILAIVIGNDIIIQAKINEITFLYANNISMNGIYSNEHAKNLKEDIAKYGNYEILNRLDINLEGDYFDSYFNDNDIIDRPLKSGDKIKIVIVNKEPPLIYQLATSFKFLTINNYNFSSLNRVVDYQFPVTKTYN